MHLCKERCISFLLFCEQFFSVTRNVSNTKCMPYGENDGFAFQNTRPVSRIYEISLPSVSSVAPSQQPSASYRPTGDLHARIYCSRKILRKTRTHIPKPAYLRRGWVASPERDAERLPRTKNHFLWLATSTTDVRSLKPLQRWQEWRMVENMRLLRREKYRRSGKLNVRF